MRVYIASSWRNELQPEVVARLRTAGHLVYDFRHPRPGDDGFSWAEIDPNWKGWSAAEYVAALSHPTAAAGFRSDMDALRRCDACVLVQPCGISAHLEFGWAVGAGKLGVVLVPGIREPELMLSMANHLALDLDDVVEWLRRQQARAESFVDLMMERVGASSYCRRCGWPMTQSADQGCVPGNCSYRPADGTEEHERMRRRDEELRTEEGFS